MNVHVDSLISGRLNVGENVHAKRGVSVFGAAV